MPLYDYRCTACGQEVEVMHGISEPGPQTCEHCGGSMRKALSPPAIHFKGSGWAKKDAASASAKKPRPEAGTAGDKDAKATGAGERSSDGTTDPGSASRSGSETKDKPASTAGSKTD